MLFWASCALAGVSLCLVIRVVTVPLSRGVKMFEEGKSRWLLRLAWPWVSSVAVVCNPFISWRLRQSLSARIQAAGLAPGIRPEHIFAMQCLASSVFAMMVALILWGQSASNIFADLINSVPAALLGFWWPSRWLRDQGNRRKREMLKEFPFLLDMTTLCVEAGLNLQGALRQAAHYGPSGPLRQELRYALADMRAGMPRLEALRHMSERTGLPAVRQLAMALSQADQLGMSLGPLLRAQSEQRRAERFLRAEKLALEAPVKMLFPMIFCIFPCTFLVIGFPLAVKLLGVQW